MNDKPENKSASRPTEKTVIKTGKATYRFDSDWTDNDALRSLLAGLVADDLVGRDGQQ